MGQGNVEIVRRMYEAFYGGDAEGALAHFDPDVEIDATARIDGGTGRGRKAVASLIGRWVGAFDDWREEIEEIRDAGEHVYVVARQHARGGGGIEVEMRYAVVYEVRGDLISRMTLYNDPEEVPLEDD